MNAPAKTSSLAVWTLIIGVLSMLCIGPLGCIVTLLAGNSALKEIKKSNGELKGTRLTVTGISIGIFGMIIWYVVWAPPLGSPEVRPRVARAKYDLRVIGVALESYFADHRCYPQSTSDISRNIYAGFGPKSKLASLPTFGLPSAGYGSITTPVAYYVASIAPDPFAPAKRAAYCYYADPANKGWILWSAGPDGKYDLTSENIGRIYNPANLNMAGDLAMQALTYDPTNGVKSSGDIWRIKQ